MEIVTHTTLSPDTHKRAAVLVEPGRMETEERQMPIANTLDSDRTPSSVNTVVALS
jgi:hypothetical protein